MRKGVGVWICVVLSCGWAVATQGERLAGQVTAVLDGNTLEIADNAHSGRRLTVRLYGVDCPELGQRTGVDARDYVKSLCLGATVSIRTQASERPDDVRGEVSLASGVNLNRRLLERGLAWLAPGISSDPELAELEQQARAAKRGLWQETSPVPPWVYRQTHPAAPATGAVVSTPSTTTAGAKPAAITVSRSAVEQAWNAHGMEMLVAAGAMPYIDASGAIAGALVTKASAVPLARQLGLRDGDVVLSVNGVTLKGLDLAAAAEQLEDKPQYRAEIIRGGRKMVLDYVVTK